MTSTSIENGPTGSRRHQFHKGISTSLKAFVPPN